jgi:spermidine/putrescine-binding protein
MWDSADSAVIVAALAAGVMNPFDMTDEEFELVRAMLELQNDLLLFYWSDPTAIEQSLAAGEIAGAYAWNSAYKNLRSQGIPVTYMQPKEGMLTWVCGLVSMTDGPADDAMRYEFMNAMLAPATGEWLIRTFGYGHANRESFVRAGPELTASLALPENPAEMFANTVVLPPMSPAVRQKYIAMFEEVKITFW